MRTDGGDSQLHFTSKLKTNNQDLISNSWGRNNESNFCKCVCWNYAKSFCLALLKPQCSSYLFPTCVFCSVCCTCGHWKSSTQRRSFFCGETMNVDIWQSILPSNKNVSNTGSLFLMASMLIFSATSDFIVYSVAYWRSLLCMLLVDF